MFAKIVLNYILGYVSIKVEGYYIERFINICISKNIILWNMKREKNSILHANIGIKEFKELKAIAKKLNCRIKIEKKKGVPFIFNKYRKRKIFALLLIMVIAFLLICSRFIWNIEIYGIEKIKLEDIKNELQINGLKIGAKKGEIDTKKIINEIRLKRSDISWIGIDINGTNAKVEIVEAKEKPQIVDENDFCNIISDKTRDNYKNKCTKRNCNSKNRRSSKNRANASRREDTGKIYRCNICKFFGRNRSKSMV